MGWVENYSVLAPRNKISPFYLHSFSFFAKKENEPKEKCLSKIMPPLRYGLFDDKGFATLISYNAAPYCATCVEGVWH
jgi:hypothetical protein